MDNVRTCHNCVNTYTNTFTDLICCTLSGEPVGNGTLALDCEDGEPVNYGPQTVYDEIAIERQYQDNLWGGPVHDDQHSSHDWLAYMTKHLGKSVIWPWDKSVFRKQMVKVAALAVAAIEWCNRKESPDANLS